MDTLVFATGNAHKLQEIRAILGHQFEIKSLNDIGCDVDIPETGSTFSENALQKAHYVKQHYGLDCFADDSGLQVEALNGQPGVFSARYAAIHGLTTSAGRDEDNMDYLLQQLATHPTEPLPSNPLQQGWPASFSTHIALIYQGQEHHFEGIIHGHIIPEKRGTHGFGYDPIFVPEGHTQTFAQLGDDIKNSMSHRARAVAQLAAFLKA